METVTPSKLKLLKPINSILSMIYHTKKNDLPFDLIATKNILVLDPTAIGDIVMLIPFLRVLKNNFCNASITLVCQKHAEYILKNLQLVDEFVIFKGNNCFLGLTEIYKNREHLKQTLKTINTKQYDIAIEPRGDIRYIFFMHYVNAKRKVSYSYSGGECFLTDSFKMPANYKETHLIEDKLNLLKKMGCKYEKADTYPYLYKNDELKQEFKHQYHLKKEILIGIHPGASKKIRQYPYYSEIIERIKNNNIFYIIFKGYNEDEAVEKIERVLRKSNKKYVVIQENLEKYIQLLGICDLVLCNDSGAGHLSAAFGNLTYVIFGPERPSGVRPYNEKNVRYVNYQLDCKPCYKLNCPQKEQYCFTKINIPKLVKLIECDLDDFQQC